MKLGYYHYYFKLRGKRKASRVAFDIRPMIAAYLGFGDNDWKAGFKTDDDEQLLLMRSEHSDVFMLIGTRRDDLIKAINAHTMTCSDLIERLEEDEEAGFAGYFTCNAKMLAMASSLRGPKTAALGRFINDLLRKLDAGRWRFELQPLGTSVSMDEAKEMSFVSRATVRVSVGSSLFGEFAQLFGQDESNVASVEVIFRARRDRNVKDVVKTMADQVGNNGLDKMTIRARAMLDDELVDYFVAAQGNFSEQIEGGSEKQITHTISHRFRQNPKARELLTELMQKEIYANPEEDEIEDLTRLADAAHWGSALQPQ